RELAGPRSGPVGRQPPIGDVPDSFLSLPSGQHDLTARPQDLEHHRGAVAVVVPAPRSPTGSRVVLQVACPEWAITTQLAQHVLAEGIVRGQPVPYVAMTGPV